MAWLIDQAFTQSGHEYELVIVEDNSPDDTYGVACELRKIYGEKKNCYSSETWKTWTWFCVYGRD